MVRVHVEGKCSEWILLLGHEEGFHMWDWIRQCIEAKEALGKMGVQSRG